MPTVIDSLVVQLGLDATSFIEGKKKVDAAFKEVGDGAKSSGRSVEKSGQDVANFFRLLEHPIQGVRQHFERLATATGSSSPVNRNLTNLASQGRRTGASVEAGAKAGAAGLRVMGIAGLATTGIVEGLDKAMRAVSAGANKTFGVGLGAAGAGLPVEDFSAITIAAKRGGHVPEADTGNFLNNLRQAQLAARRNEMGPLTAINRALVTAGMTGFDVWHDDPERLSAKIAARFAQITPDAAISFGQPLGASPVLSRWLHNVGTNFSSEVTTARKLAITKADTDASEKLLHAQDDLETSWNRLSTTIDTELTPGLTLWEGWLKKIIDDITEGQGKTYGSEGESETSGAVPGSWWDRTMPRWLGGHRGDASVVPPLITSATGSVASIAMPRDTGLSGAELDINNFGGLRRPGIIAGPKSGGFQSFATAEEGIRAAAHLLLTYQDVHHLNTIRGILNRWAPPSDNGGDAGFSRLLAGATRMTGFGADQPLNLHDSSTLARVTEAFIQNEVGKAGPSQIVVDRALGRGAVNMQSQLAWARRGGGVSNTSNRSVEVNTGPINITTTAQHARAIASEIGGELKNVFVGQVNTGLE